MPGHEPLPLRLSLSVPPGGRGAAGRLIGPDRSFRAHHPLRCVGLRASNDGELLQVFVRPHDLKLRRVRSVQHGLAMARVERLKRIGGYVRISLALPGGEMLTVESPRAEIDELGVAVGEPVVVDLRAARLFTEHAAH
jgi:TOBE domain